MKKAVCIIISVLFIFVFAVSYLTKSVDVLSEGLTFPCEKIVIIDAGHGACVLSIVILIQFIKTNKVVDIYLLPYSY